MPKPVTIDIETVQQDPERANILYGSIDVVAKMYSMNRSTLKNWLMDMREHPKFKHGVLNPTHKIVLIKLDVFEEYVIWLSVNRYRRSN